MTFREKFDFDFWVHVQPRHPNMAISKHPQPDQCKTKTGCCGFSFTLERKSKSRLWSTCVFSLQLPPPVRPPAWPRGSVRSRPFLQKTTKSRIRASNHRQALTASSCPTGNQSGSRRNQESARPVCLPS